MGSNPKNRTSFSVVQRKPFPAISQAQPRSRPEISHSHSPGTDSEISSFCQLNYGVTFQMMKKIDVNGENAHPIFKYLTSETRGFLGKRIKWNFTKFLISRDGTKIKRYPPTKAPQKIEKDIEEMI